MGAGLSRFHPGHRRGKRSWRSGGSRVACMEASSGIHMMDYSGECPVCGERMEEKRVKQAFWIKGKLVVIERTPAGVCPLCGEKVVKAGVGHSIAALLGDLKRRRRARRMTVPVISFTREVA